MTNLTPLQACFAALVPVVFNDAHHLKPEHVQAAIAPVLFPETGQPTNHEAYTHLITTAADLLTANGYLIPVSLAPPAVPFTAAGNYLQQMAAIDWEADIAPALADQYRSSIDTNYPYQYITRKRLVKRLAQEKLGRAWRELEKTVLVRIAAAVDGLFVQRGWTVSDDQQQYKKRLDPSTDEATSHERLCGYIRAQAGNQIDHHACHEQAMKAVYGRRFYQFDKQHEAWAYCVGVLEAALTTCGYQTTTTEAAYWPVPLALPTEITEAISVAFTDTPRYMTDYGWVYEQAALDAALIAACGYDPAVILPTQAKQLLTQPVIRAAFDSRQMRRSAVFFQPQHFIPPRAHTGERRIAVYRFRQTVVIDPSHTLKLDKDHKLPVLSPVAIVDDESCQIVMLQMIGIPQAVKANWANLMSLGRSSIYVDGNYVRMQGMKKHVLIKARLPMGLDDWVLLHKQASVREMSPTEPFFVLSADPLAIPENFFPMLDKAIPLPLQRAWTAYLWEVGRRKRLIELCNDESYGMLAYRIAPDVAAWQEVLQTGLNEKALTISLPSAVATHNTANGATDEPDGADVALPAASGDAEANPYAPFQPEDVVSVYTVDDGIADGTHIPLMMENQMLEAHRFPPGRVVIAVGAKQQCETAGIDPVVYLHRHLAGDWGDLGDDDKQRNEAALKNNTRLFSMYKTAGGKLYVITEWDRSVTTILLPSEY